MLAFVSSIQEPDTTGLRKELNSLCFLAELVTSLFSSKETMKKFPLQTKGIISSFTKILFSQIKELNFPKTVVSDQRKREVKALTGSETSEESEDYCRGLFLNLSSQLILLASSSFGFSSLTRRLMSLNKLVEFPNSDKGDMVQAKSKALVKKRQTKEEVLNVVKE